MPVLPPTAINLGVAKLLFDVPMLGSLSLLLAALLLFIAKIQMQAMQMTFFLPSLLLSGFIG